MFRLRFSVPPPVVAAVWSADGTQMNMHVCQRNPDKKMETDSLRKSRPKPSTRQPPHLRLGGMPHTAMLYASYMTTRRRFGCSWETCSNAERESRSSMVAPQLLSLFYLDFENELAEWLKVRPNKTTKWAIHGQVCVKMNSPPPLYFAVSSWHVVGESPTLHTP